MGAPSYPYGDIGADIPDLDSTPIAPIPSAPSRPAKVNTLSYILFISQININLET